MDLLLGIYTKIDYNTEKQHMDYLGQVFANLTQCKEGRTFILDRDHLRKCRLSFKQTLIAVSNQYRTVAESQSYLLSLYVILKFLSNQSERIQKLIPFINHDSLTRRGSTCIMLKNICFDSEVNQWLLGPSVDLLPTLLKVFYLLNIEKKKFKTLL